MEAKYSPGQGLRRKPARDRAGRRRLVPESLEVRLAERAFPGERLAAHFPGPQTAVLLLALGHLRQLGSQAGHMIEGLHGSNRTAETPAPELGVTVRSK